MIDLLIPGRARDIDGFSVFRVLPYPARRSVGPFVFFDHIGPATLPPGKGLDVRPHPHINLATVTYLFSGEIIHRDSLGFHQAITPGDVNWMTAGRGIVHSERSSAEARRDGAHLHGLQLWLALPRAHEEVAPSFVHHPAASLPVFDEQGARVRLLAGELFGRRSPVSTLSPLFYADIELGARARFVVPPAYDERAIYVVEGEAHVGDTLAPRGTMAVLARGAEATVLSERGARVVVLGGARLDGERHIEWNFVSSSLDRIERAKAEWREDRFPKIPGDSDERIPLP